MFLSFCVFNDFFFRFFKKLGFLGILGPPYCGIGATIRIGREMLFLPYAGFFWYHCFYSHKSRDALSPVCGIFFSVILLVNSSVYLKWNQWQDNYPRSIFTWMVETCVTRLKPALTDVTRTTMGWAGRRKYWHKSSKEKELSGEI